MFIFKSQFSDLIVSSHVLNYTKLPLVSSSYCTIKITQTFVTQTKLLPPSITSSSSEKKMPLASLRVLSSLTRLWSTRSWPENQMHENLHTRTIRRLIRSLCEEMLPPGRDTITLDIRRTSRTLIAIQKVVAFPAWFPTSTTFPRPINAASSASTRGFNRFQWRESF